MSLEHGQNGGNIDVERLIKESDILFTDEPNDLEEAVSTGVARCWRCPSSQEMSHASGIVEAISIAAEKENLTLYEFGEEYGLFPSRIPLSSKEERELTRWYCELRDCDGKLEDDADVVRAEEYIRFKNMLREAETLLIEANQRLVLALAIRSRDRGVPIYDLFQEGNIGLLKAARRFDYKRGFKFSTCATWWIRSKISRMVRDSNIIRAPSYVYDLASVAAKGGSLTDQERRILRLFRQAKETVSSDNFLDLDDDIEGNRLDYYFFTASDNVESEVLHKEFGEKIGEVFESLTSRQETILRMRFGIYNDGPRVPMTLEEVGRKMGITRERVRQLEKEALERMRVNKKRRKSLIGFY